ncbi:hypothetical protein P4E94_17275 [Pontiellaceae bacterium B12219]|nr:hypothetical protein [Pontiellaceae bacterium B12219]
MSNQCPFCDEEGADKGLRASSPEVHHICCSVCGEFEYSPVLLRGLSGDERAKYRVLLQIRKLRRLGRLCLLETVPKKLNGLMFNVVDKISFLKQWPSGSHFFDEILLNLSFLEPVPGKTIRFETDARDGHSRPWAYALYDLDRKGAQKFSVEALCDAGFLKQSGSHYMITAKGWERIESLRTKESGTAFVAMWFDDSTKPLKREIEKAVAGAGYRAEALTVDEVEHNEYIMDKVINLINDARFVIADFTCIEEGEVINGKVKGGSRGGVYFEAGYAKGQNKQVILTCRNDEDSKSRRHFDIEQINTIFWEDSDGGVKAGGLLFADVLKNRIIQTIGQGPYDAN